jgi:site-specific recombinase XerD
MDSGLVPVPPRRELSRTDLGRLPAPVARAGEDTIKRFLEFFAGSIRNRHTRRAYFRATVRFFNWCERHHIRELSAIEPLHVAAYVEQRGGEVKKPSVKQEFAAIRMLFNWFVVGAILRSNPAAAVRGPRYSVRKGKTPILSPAEARQLLDSIDTSTIVGLRDRAIISTGLYTFGRVNALATIKVEDCYVQQRRLWIRLQEKNGKVIEMPCHHELERDLYAYIETAGIADEKDSPLFRSTVGKTKVLTDRPLFQQNIYDMIRRRVLAAGIKTKLGCHGTRGTGITAYLKNGGKLEIAQNMAGHADPRTTKFYDRRGDEVSLDEVERISFSLDS